MRPFKPEPEDKGGFFDTLKRGAKKLGKDAASAAKQAAEAPPPDAKPGEQLTVRYRPDKEDWVVETPSNYTLSKHTGKQGAVTDARSRVASSDKYNQVQVLKKTGTSPRDMIESREEFQATQSGQGGPSLPGFGAPEDGPRVGMPMDESDDETRGPYVPETLFDE